jgi:DNA repair protein RadC
MARKKSLTGEKVSLCLVKEYSPMYKVESVSIKSSVSATSFFRKYFETSPVERFVALMLDAGMRPLCHYVTEGDVTQCSVFPATIAKVALLANAANVVIAHNHPGGNKEFSSPDRQITRRILEGLNLFGITLTDHLLYADGDWLSLAERGEI